MHIHTHIEEIDSFDAQFHELSFDGKHLVVPYANLGISDHPWHPDSELAFLPVALVVAQNLSYLKVEQNVLLDARSEGEEIHYFGGIPIEPTATIEEFELCAERVWLVVPEGQKPGPKTPPPDDPSDWETWLGMKEEALQLLGLDAFDAQAFETNENLLG